MGLFRREIADLPGLAEATVSRHAAAGKYGPGAKSPASGRVEFDDEAVRRRHARVSAAAIDAIRAKRRRAPSERLYTRHQVDAEVAAALEQRNAAWLAWAISRLTAAAAAAQGE